jgi:hypothetical protein
MEVPCECEAAFLDARVAKGPVEAGLAPEAAQADGELRIVDELAHGQLGDRQAARAGAVPLLGHVIHLACPSA